MDNPEGGEVAERVGEDLGKAEEVEVAAEVEEAEAVEEEFQS